MTGAVHMLFLENVIGNAYQNLSNIVLTIRPADLSTEQGVLIASHYDSLIGSPGAASREVLLVWLVLVTLVARAVSTP